MASVSTNNSGGKVRFDIEDWLAGLAPFWGGNNEVFSFGTKGFVLSTAIDPLRFYGAVSPGLAAVATTNQSQATTYAKDGVNLSGFGYITAGASLLKLNYTTNTFVSSADWSHTITPHGGHSTVVADSTEVYYIGSTPYVFYSWNDDADGDVGRLEPSGPTFDDDYMSTVPTSGAVLNKNFPHPMLTGDDGILYIANGNNLASFNGTTFNSSALDLPNGFVITSMAKTQNYFVLFAVRPTGTFALTTSFDRQECVAYFWDYVSSSFTYAIPLNGNVVNGGFSWNGTVGCFVSGSYDFTTNNRKSALLLWNGGGSFDQVCLFTTNIPSNGGVEVGNKVVTWNSEGHIYQFGNPFGGEMVLNRIAKVTGSNSGMLRCFADNRFFASSDNEKFERLNGYYDGANFYTVNINLPFTELQKGRVKKIKVYWNSIGSESTKKYRVDLYYRVNNGETIVRCLNQSDNANFSTDITNDDWVTILHQNADGSAFQTFSGSIALYAVYYTLSNTITPPIIKAVEIYYENVAVT